MANELTERERQILRHLGAGMRDKEIAAELAISVHTVRTHVRNICRTLGAKTRFQAAALGVKRETHRSR